MGSDQTRWRRFSDMPVAYHAQPRESGTGCLTYSASLPGLIYANAQTQDTGQPIRCRGQRRR